MSDRPYIIWKGHGNDAAIYCARNDGSSFDYVHQVGYFATSRGLAAVKSEGVVAAWRGLGDDSRIWTAEANFDGTGWSDQRRPPDDPRTEDRPALAVFRGQIVMAWRGAGSDEHIWFSQRGPHGWSPQQVAGNGLASSTHGPALAAHRDSLYMAWKGSGADQNLYWSAFDGSRWTDPRAFPGGSTHGPALTGTGRELVMAWKGSGNDDHVWTASFSNSWTDQRLAVGRSSHGPALGVLDGRPAMLWKGAPGDERLFWSRNLTTQEPVRDGFTTSESPALLSLNFSDL